MPPPPKSAKKGKDKGAATGEKNGEEDGAKEHDGDQAAETQAESPLEIAKRACALGDMGALGKLLAEVTRRSSASMRWHAWMLGGAASIGSSRTPQPVARAAAWCSVGDMASVMGVSCPLQGESQWKPKEALEEINGKVPVDKHPVFLAVGNARLPALKAILDAGADPNCLAKDLEVSDITLTPLGFARLRCPPDALWPLLARSPWCTLASLDSISTVHSGRSCIRTSCTGAPCFRRPWPPGAWQR